MIRVVLGLIFITVIGEVVCQSISVQSLHVVGNLIKSRYPSHSGGSDENTRGDSKREELMKTRDLEIQRSRFDAAESARKLLRLKRQPPDSGEQVEGRRHHSIYDPLAWTDAFADVLVGHGGLFSGNGGHFGGHNHGSLFGGHQKKKKKKKKPQGGHFQQLGGHQHGHGGHFGSHGSGHGSHGGPQIFGGNNRPYEVTENFDDIAPQGGFFSWFQQTQKSPQIQNKIAPRY